MIDHMDLRGKKALQMGLGILGGGVATARWLLEQGAILTVTDLKDEEYLKISLEKLEDVKDKINFVLGEHRESDFLENDVVVINPDVSKENKFVKIALDAGKQIENELTLFYKFCPTKNIIAITGTRGKTTTVNWTAHILKSKFPDTKILGNDPNKPLLQEIKGCNQDSLVVIEAPSFLLEICGGSNFVPHVAVITNLYADHLNRHKTMEGYALAKANIFISQTENDFLVLDKENEWTKFFLNLKPKAKVLFDSDQEGLSNETEFIKVWGEHNLANFVKAKTVAKIFGLSDEEINNTIESLPQIKFRQERVYKSDYLEIYNDTAATSPEALTASMKRFLNKPNDAVFIIGGTDRELDFSLWGKEILGLIDIQNLVLLSGSATEKMKKELGENKFNEFDTLPECFNFALDLAKQKNIKKIVFSPGAKSFEKFKNEFDRGEKFNLLVKQCLLNIS